MNKFILFFLSNLILISNVHAGTNCNLKGIFQTPRKRNYDELQILERSNFLIDDQGEDPQKIKLQPNAAPNAKILLKLGDYKTAIRKNNNNVNTRITLAGPNHNNYYPHPLIYPSYEIPPQNNHPWNYAYSAPRTPQYYIFSGPNYVPRYQIIPQNIPIFEQTKENPIIFSSAIQHIPHASSRTSSSPSNGLNTMTMIPKILIDSVVKKPEILEIIETQKPEMPIPSETAPITQTPENGKKEIGEEQVPPKEEISATEEILTENFENKENSVPQISEVIEILPQISENTSQQVENSEKPQITETIVEENIVPNSEKPQITETIVEENIVPTELADKNENGNLNQPEEVHEETLKIETKPVVENVVINLQSKPCEINNIDHPRVLHPVKLSSNIENVEILGAGSLNMSMSNIGSQLLENCSNSKDFELVNLLQKSLVPFINLKTKAEPKFLVSYPVIHGANSLPHPTAVVVEAVEAEPSYCQECNCKNRRGPKTDIDDLNIMRGAIVQAPNIVQSSGGYQISSLNSKVSQPDDGITSTISGYQISSGSGYYEDPTKRIVYSKPTEIVVVPPQISHSHPNLIPQPYPLEPPTNLLPNFGGWQQNVDEFPAVDTSSSNLMNLLQYIVSNSVLPKFTSVPTIVRCPHCSKHHVVSGRNIIPVQTSCANQRSQPTVDEPWNPKPLPRRCPYCAKYTGELNQLG